MTSDHQPSPLRMSNALNKTGSKSTKTHLIHSVPFTVVSRLVNNMTILQQVKFKLNFLSLGLTLFYSKKIINFTLKLAIVASLMSLAVVHAGLPPGVPIFPQSPLRPPLVMEILSHRFPRVFLLSKMISVKFKIWIHFSVARSRFSLFRQRLQRQRTFSPATESWKRCHRTVKSRALIYSLIAHFGLDNFLIELQVQSFTSGWETANCYVYCRWKWVSS